MKLFGRTSVVVVVIVVVALAAFGVGVLAGNNRSSSSSTSEGNKVTVTLTDMHIDSSQTTFKTGVTYHFVVTNKGAVNHELMIMKPMAPGTMSMEEMDKMAVADIESDDLPPGATETIEVTFDKAYPAGSLEMACHLTGHYEAGMHLGITVDAS